jgi:hypothetical protein
MKCKQKLCQRSKQIGVSGNCNVCEDVVKDVSDKHRKINEKKTLQKVKVDLKQMIDIHSKLSKGDKIDQQTISVLILGGIINITSQHDAIEELEVRIKHLEHEKITTNTRMEALENWVLKQNDLIEDLDAKVSKTDVDDVKVDHSSEITHIKNRIKSLEARSGGDQSTPKKKEKDNLEIKKDISCKLCDETFLRNSDFERHLEEEHKLRKTFECDTCGKAFHLKWRLGKHKELHSGNYKFCHFYNNGENCPFEAIGCMYHHSKAGLCKNANCTNAMCQFEHASEFSDKQVDENETNEQIGEKDCHMGSDSDSATYGENDCHLCEQTFTSLDDLCGHFQTNHEEYYTKTQNLVVF